MVARHLRIEPPTTPDLWPEGYTPREVAEAADAEFGRLLDLPASAAFRYPWPSLDAAAGGMTPGGVIVVQARTGQGKTTFTRSLVDVCLSRGRKTYVHATESTPGTWRGSWACMLAGENPGYWFSLDAQRDRDSGRLPPEDYERRRERIEAARRDVRSKLAGEGVYVDPTTFVTCETLRGSYRRAQQLGSALMLIDHIDLVRPATGDRQSQYAESVRAMDLVLTLSQETSIATMVMSQTGADKVKGPILGQFDPPTLGDVYMGQHKNHHATHSLGLFRPRAAACDKEMVRQVNAKVRPAPDALEPNRMGVIINKNRNSGADGLQVVLAFDRGRIRELTDDEARDEHARVHAIRTNRDL